MLDQKSVDDLIRVAHSDENVREKVLPVIVEAQKRSRVAKVKTDRECMKRYQTDKGDFKGGKGKAFDNCVKAFTECSNAKKPEGLCAFIGREHGKIGRLVTREDQNAAWDAAFKVASDLGETPRVSSLFADLVLEQNTPRGDDMLTREEVRSLCAACAEKMEKKGLTKIAYHVLLSSPDYLG